VRLLLDEMYPEAMAEALRKIGVEAVTVASLGLTGRSDLDIFVAAIADGYTVLTENVGDFTRIAGEHVVGGHHHPGLLIALSSRFSRRPAGREKLAAAILTELDEPLDDRVIYLPDR
jgi:Domain of unknown function (DUF5615)